jgi:xanthine dehydrogenase YagS FAD-binding subunit
MHSRWSRWRRRSTSTRASCAICAIALGGVAHKPWRAVQAQSALRGARATVENFRSAAEAELAGARVQNGNAYKVPMARNTLIAVLRDLSREGQS